jgi:hypothetical protein
LLEKGRVVAFSGQRYNGKIGPMAIPENFLRATGTLLAVPAADDEPSTAKKAVVVNPSGKEDASVVVTGGRLPSDYQAVDLNAVQGEIEDLRDHPSRARSHSGVSTHGVDVR